MAASARPALSTLVAEGVGESGQGGHHAERRRIRTAFDLFDRDGKKIVPKESEHDGEEEQAWQGEWNWLAREWDRLLTLAPSLLRLMIALR